MYLVLYVGLGRRQVSRSRVIKGKALLEVVVLKDVDIIRPKAFGRVKVNGVVNGARVLSLLSLRLMGLLL